MDKQPNEKKKKKKLDAHSSSELIMYENNIIT